MSKGQQFVAGWFTQVHLPGLPELPPGSPDIGLPGVPDEPGEGEGTPEHPIARPPWYGKPLPPLPPIPPLPPDWKPPVVPPDWERPPLPPFLGGLPEHPIVVPEPPGLPDGPEVLPPGGVWPPIPPDLGLQGKMLLLCWVPGVGLRWIVVELPELPGIPHWPKPPAGGIIGTPPARPGGGR